MIKDFFALAGSIHHSYKEELKVPLQEDNALLSNRDAYDAILWHDDDGSYVSIQNREVSEKRFEAWITPEQALKLLEVLQGQQNRLQELCNKGKQQ